MKFPLLFISFFISNFLFAQCLSGDCNNGKGKYDYGYAIYDGEFKNGEPNGRGIMDYGKGEKYDGEFKNGKENGKGLYIKDGQIKPVQYVDGELQKIDNLVSVGARPQMEGCKSGDCENGYGTAVFESGNRYEGSFKNYRFHGKGKMTFASGNVIEGEFSENKPVTGTCTYTYEKMKFTGTFNSDGTPHSGTYSYPENQSTVTLENNKVTKVHNPKAEAAKKQQEQMNRKPTACSQCNGAGYYTSTKTSTYSTGGTYYISQYNYYHVQVTPPTTVTSTSKVVNVCTKCGGKGHF
jgi:hypothetical protein